MPPAAQGSGRDPVAPDCAYNVVTTRTAPAVIRRFRALLLLVALAAAGPALAKVLAEGKPKGGFYWQKVEQSNGVRYLCRSTSDPKIQKASQCTSAGAVKP